MVIWGVIGRGMVSTWQCRWPRIDISKFFWVIQKPFSKIFEGPSKTLTVRTYWHGIGRVSNRRYPNVCPTCLYAQKIKFRISNTSFWEIKISKNLKKWQNRHFEAFRGEKACWNFPLILITIEWSTLWQNFKSLTQNPAHLEKRGQNVIFKNFGQNDFESQILWLE